MSFTNILLILIMLVLLPTLSGYGLGRLLRVDGKLSDAVIMGYLLLWTVIQIMSVPVTLMKGSFRLIAWTTAAVLIAFAAVGITAFIKQGKSSEKSKDKTEKLSVYALILAVGCIAFTLFIVYKIISLYHFDADDTRYVVNAVDIVRTDKILLTDPTSGTGFTLRYGDFYKDLVSSWSVFLAYAGYMTRLLPTIAAHTVLHVILYLLIICLYWKLSGVLIPETEERDRSSRLEGRCIMVYLVQLLIAYGYYSVQSSETFILTRLWQGKAMAAGFGVPLLFLMGLRLYEKPDRKALWAILLLAEFSLCHMSAMGIVIAAIVTAVMSFCIAIAKKKPLVLILGMLCCIPSAAYFVIGRMVDFYKFITG